MKPYKTRKENIEKETFIHDICVKEKNMSHINKTIHKKYGRPLTKKEELKCLSIHG
jgi:hypothetical protein